MRVSISVQIVAGLGHPPGPALAACASHSRPPSADPGTRAAGDQSQRAWQHAARPAVPSALSTRGGRGLSWHKPTYSCTAAFCKWFHKHCLKQAHPDGGMPAVVLIDESHQGLGRSHPLGALHQKGKPCSHIVASSLLLLRVHTSGLCPARLARPTGSPDMQPQLQAVCTPSAHPRLHGRHQRVPLLQEVGGAPRQRRVLWMKV